MSLRRSTGGGLAGIGPALPALLLLFVFFLFPVARMLGFSVEGGTLDWYAKALGEGLYVQVFPPVAKNCAITGSFTNDPLGRVLISQGVNIHR